MFIHKGIVVFLFAVMFFIGLSLFASETKAHPFEMSSDTIVSSHTDHEHSDPCSSHDGCTHSHSHQSHGAHTHVGGCCAQSAIFNCLCHAMDLSCAFMPVDFYTPESTFANAFLNSLDRPPKA